MRRAAAGLLAGFMIASGASRLIPEARGADGPNFLAEVSRAVVSAAVGETRDRPETVNDEISGTRVTGSGQSHTDVTVEFVPCDHRAVLDLVLAGTVKTKTVGVNGGIRVFTNGMTQFTGRKRVSLDTERIECQPASVRVRLDTELAGVGTGVGGPIGRLVSGIAARSFYRDQDENNRDAAQQTERQITEEFDRDAGRQLADADRVYREQRAELRRRGLWPQELRLSTTTDEVRLRGRLNTFSGEPEASAGGGALASGSPLNPPAVVGKPDIAVRVHESLFNSAAARHYGGQTVTGDELDRDFTIILGPLSPAGGRLEPEEKEQFTITFAAAPLTVAFTEGQIRAIIRTRGFTADDRQITDPFDIRVVCELTRTPVGLTVLRRELEVLPPDVTAGKRRMSLRENSLAKLLSKRFAKLLPERQEIVLADLPGGLKKLGRLLPTQTVAEDGWLALAWRRVP